MCSAHTFQRLMIKVVSYLLGSAVYLDDLGIFWDMGNIFWEIGLGTPNLKLSQTWVWQSHCYSIFFESCRARWSKLNWTYTNLDMKHMRGTENLAADAHSHAPCVQWFVLILFSVLDFPCYWIDLRVVGWLVGELGVNLECNSLLNFVKGKFLPCVGGLWTLL